MKNYSQNNQQQIILNYFAEKQIQINNIKAYNIGAYTGVDLDNCYALLLQGAKVISVQPSPSVLPIITQNYKNFPNGIIVPFAIAKEKCVLEWYDSEHNAVCSSDIQHVKKWQKGSTVKFTKTHVNAISITDLFNQYGYDADFISLDIEGQNINIFRDIDFSKHNNIKLFCIEHDNNQDQIIKTLKPLGFKELTRNAQNIILGK